MMLNYGLPLSAYTIQAGLLTQIYLFIVPSFVNDTLYGNYLTAANFAVLLTFLTTPISTVLFPAFAKLDTQNDDELVKTLYASSIKYTSILLIPSTLAMMALATPMIGTLYGQKYVYGPFYLTIAVIINLLAVAGSISATSLLTGLGETRILMIQGAITIAIGLPLGFFLIPAYGIVGLIIAGLLATLPGTMWVLYWIWKQYQAKADFKSSTRILAASALAAAIAYLPNLLNIADWIKLIFGLVVMITVYILSAPLIGAVSVTDINNLRTMFSGLGIVTKIINIPLRIAEKVALIRSSNEDAVKPSRRGEA
jgi:O-antigen/teichoic acid export membrane protein